MQAFTWIHDTLPHSQQQKNSKPETHLHLRRRPRQRAPPHCTLPPACTTEGGNAPVLATHRARARERIRKCKRAAFIQLTSRTSGGSYRRSWWGRRTRRATTLRPWGSSRRRCCCQRQWQSGTGGRSGRVGEGDGRSGAGATCTPPPPPSP